MSEVDVSRRRILGVAASLIGAGLASPPSAQTRDKLTLVVSSDEGGATDFVGRLLAHGLEDRLGAQVQVINIAGRSGLAGAELVARSRPDGRTLLVTSNSTFLTAATLCGASPAEPESGLAPLGLLATNAMVLCVSPDAGIFDLAGLSQLARRVDSPLVFSSPGFGGINHLAMEMLARRAGFRVEHRAADSVRSAMQMVLDGVAQLAFCSVEVALPYVEAGMIRAVAVSRALRLPKLPQVPTLDEAGVSGFTATIDYALFAPAGTPAPVLRRLGAASQEVMSTPAMRRQLAIVSMLTVGTGPDEFPQYLVHERAQWQDLLEVNRPVPQPGDC